MSDLEKVFLQQWKCVFLYLFQLMQAKEKKEGNEDEKNYMCFKLFLFRFYTTAFGF